MSQSQVSPARGVQLRSLGLTLNGQFGAFPPTRLSQLVELVTPAYPQRPQLSVGGAVSGLPGMNIFAGPFGALVVGPTAWVANFTAAKPSVDFQDTAALYRSAVERGLAPDEVTFNVQTAFSLSVAGAPRLLLSQLPWDEIAGTAFMWDPLESTCRHASLSIL